MPSDQKPSGSPSKPRSNSPAVDNVYDTNTQLMMKILENQDKLTHQSIEDVTRPQQQQNSRLKRRKSNSSNVVLKNKLRVAVSINVFSVVAVDTVAQTFEATFCLRMTTTNADQVKTEFGDSITVDNFDPRLKMSNLFDTKKWKMKPSLEEDGVNVSYKYEISGTFSEQVSS